MSNKMQPPDFDAMLSKAEEVGKLTRIKNICDIELKAMEAEFMKNSTQSAQGKAPSMDFLKFAVKQQFLDKRMELAEADAQLEKCKLTFQVMRDIVSVYITESAAQRAGVL